MFHTLITLIPQSFTFSFSSSSSFSSLTSSPPLTTVYCCVCTCPGLFRFPFDFLFSSFLFLFCHHHVHMNHVFDHTHSSPPFFLSSIIVHSVSHFIRISTSNLLLHDTHRLQIYRYTSTLNQDTRMPVLCSTLQINVVTEH